MNKKLIKQKINENIPRDLLKAYHAANAYDSEIHPDTDHITVNSSNRRGRVKYDYGKATYEVISVADALALIAQDPHNVEKIRGIRAGELVEYEYRNGKFYALYANPDREVVITKPDGSETRKRNIRYITNPKIWLPLLDKIYVTNEYDYPISDEDRAKKVRKSDYVAVSKFEPTTDPNYSQFDPASHLQRNAQTIHPVEIDTGSHSAENLWITPTASVNIPGVETLVRFDLSSEARDILRDYRAAKKSKNEAFSKYANARGALRKLNRDKDDYDDDEFEELIDKFTAKERDAKAEYDEAALHYSRVYSKIKKYLNSAGNEYSNKFASVIVRISTALRKCVGLKKAIDTLKAKAVDELDSNDLRDVTNQINPNYRYDNSDEYKTVQTLMTTISSIKQEIDTLISELEQLRDSAETIDNNANTQRSADEEQKLQQIELRNAELTQIKKSLLNYYNEYYLKLAAKVDEIEEVLNRVKPGHAERKARAKAAAGQAVLDPAIADIIQFED